MSTATSNLLPSLIRTLIPVVVGVLASLGLGYDDQNVAVLLTGVIAFVFYAVVRFLEVYAGPKWGYILGIAKSPGYSPKDPPATAPVGSSRLTNDDRGVGVVGLIAAIVLALAVFFILLPQFAR